MPKPILNYSVTSMRVKGVAPQQQTESGISRDLEVSSNKKPHCSH